MASSSTVLNPEDLLKMRASCSLAAECLTMLGEYVKAGITTDEIDRIANEWIVARGAYPSPLNYRPRGAPRAYPKSVCTSVNEVVCHGIPAARELKNGDIINIDVTTYYQGFHGDTSATFYVGEPSEQAKHVVETARKSLELGIAQVKDGARLGDIGAAIQQYAELRGCSVVRDYVGHGVGSEFHMAPQVPHYGKKGSGERIRAGMIFTIEPMINAGHYSTRALDDGWTVVTFDHSLSAQFEHTILVTKTGAEVLTSRPGALTNSEDRDYALLGPLGTAKALEVRTSSAAT